jgi:hypothetical protein
MPKSIGSMEDSRYLCLVDNEIDHDRCPYPEITKVLERADERGFAVGVDEKTPEEKALDQVLVVAEGFLKEYRVANKIRLLELASAAERARWFTAEELADKASALYAQLDTR